MANIDDIAYAIGADKKNPTGIKDWFGRVVSLSPFKVARLGSEIGVECVNLAAASVGDMVYVLKRPDGQHVSIGTVGGGAIPAVLYDNPSGTTGNITLEDSAANYDYMRIYFFKNGDSSARSSSDVYQPDGKRVSLLMVNPYDDSNVQAVGKAVTISGTSVTNYRRETYANTGNGGIFTTTSSPTISIYRIEAWSGGASIGFGGGSGGGGGSQIDLLWTNPNPTSAFAAQDVSAAWQNYRFLIVEHYTDTIGGLGSHTEFDIVTTNSISDWVFLRAHREVWFMRGVQFPSSGTVHFGSTFYPSTYNSGSFSQTDSYPWVVPTRIWGVKDGGGASGVVEATCTLDTTYASTGRSTVKVFKNGDVCTITFIPLILKAQSGRNTFGTVPEGFRPVGGEYYIHPNGWAPEYYLIVGTDGTLKANVNLGGENESYASGTYVIGG